MRSLLAFLGYSLCALLIAAQPVRAQTAASDRVALTLTMRLHDAARLEALIRAQSDPRSPFYAHFLSPAQFEAAFAPTPAEYAATVARLQASGIRVERTYRSRMAIVASASAAVARRVFAAHPHSHRSFDVPRELTATVDTVVGAIAGVSTVSTAHAFARPAVTRIASAAKTATTATSLYGPDDGFGPTGVTVANDFPVMHGLRGRGIKVADVIDNPVSDANVAVFLSKFGITRTGPPTKNIGFAVTPDYFQPDFDAEWVIGTAPGVAYYDYQYEFGLDPYILAAIAQVVDDNIADVVNVSFAACESDDTLALALAPILSRAAAEGITFEGVTFGGPNDCSPKLAANEIPSGDEHVLAVSGTDAAEQNDGTLIVQSGLPQSGGGVSLIFPVPSWQRTVAGVDTAGRNTPDIVLSTEVNGTGPSAYTANSDEFGGYYPAAWDGGAVFVNNAPAAGMLAEIQQMVGHRLGAFGQTLYALYAENGYGTAFHDVIVGCDGVLYGKPFCAKPGYDLTSGIGSIDAYRIGKLLQ
jgi:kumamolisin